MATGRPLKVQDATGGTEDVVACAGGKGRVHAGHAVRRALGHRQLHQRLHGSETV